MISSLNNKLDSHDPFGLPTYFKVPVKNRGSATSDFPNFCQLGRVQAFAALVGIITTLVLISNPHWIHLRSELPRFLALLTTSIFTERAFSSSSEDFAHNTATRGESRLQRIALALQFLWVLSEIVFSSAFAPLLIAAVPALAITVSGFFVLRLLPLCAMVSFTGCFDAISKFRSRRRHRRLSSFGSGDLSNITDSNGIKSNLIMVPSQHHHHHHTGYVDTTPLSPADSFASGSSSGALASGLPSPTGICPSPDRAAMLRYSTECNNGRCTTNTTAERKTATAALLSCDIYLQQHILDTNESMLFVHKKLKPIKTRIVDEEYVQMTSQYKPVLSQMMTIHTQTQQQQQQQSGMCAPGPPLTRPAVVATISLVPKGKAAAHPTTHMIAAV